MIRSKYRFAEIAAVALALVGFSPHSFAQSFDNTGVTIVDTTCTALTSGKSSHTIAKKLDTSQDATNASHLVKLVHHGGATDRQKLLYVAQVALNPAAMIYVPLTWQLAYTGSTDRMQTIIA